MTPNLHSNSQSSTNHFKSPQTYHFQIISLTGNPGAGAHLQLLLRPCHPHRLPLVGSGRTVQRCARTWPTIARQAPRPTPQNDEQEWMTLLKSQRFVGIATLERCDSSRRKRFNFSWSIPLFIFLQSLLRIGFFLGFMLCPSYVLSFTWQVKSNEILVQSVLQSLN